MFPSPPRLAGQRGNTTYWQEPYLQVTAPLAVPPIEVVAWVLNVSLMAVAELVA